MKIIYFGSSGPLSTIPLLRLINSKHTICAVAIDSNKYNKNQTKPVKVIPVFDENTSSIATLATINKIPVIELSVDMNDQAIADYAPDVVIASCFARKIPDRVCSIAKYGAFNLHPSLLPAFRGPTPLFWQFRAGVETFGITLHRLSSQWDAGNIIVQSAVNMSDGISHIKACQLLALEASKLIEQCLHQLQNQSISEITQVKELASYQGFPKANDFIVSNLWPAKRIFNFICATRNGVMTYPCQINDHIYRLQNALDFNAHGYADFQINGRQITFPCRPGYITAMIDSKQ